MRSAADDVTVGACRHCDLPIPQDRMDAGSPFCCNGCESVYAILHEAGFDDTYYRLRDASDRRSMRSPARTTNPQALLDELDSSVFLESHSTRLDGGTYRTHLYLDGVHCAACVWLVERLPEQLDGVSSAHLNLPRARLTLDWDPARLHLSAIASWLASFGYAVQPRVDGEEAPESREERRLLIRMGVAWALAGNIMLLAFALYSGLGAESPELYHAARGLSLFLAVPAVFYGGSVFFAKAWHSIRLSWRLRTIRHLHMDTPISIGILAGFGASLVSTLTGRGDVWFDSVAVLIAALLSARWLQLRARRLAGDSTEQLLALLPTLARRADGSTVRADELQADDVILVRAGELIPVDGVIVEGSSLINSAVLTGESQPVRHGTGAQVHAGTTNETETIVVRVQRAGAATRVGQLLSLVGDPASDAPRILGLADRIGGLFTISVLGLAVVAAIAWGIIRPEETVMHLVAFLVITCPCALGMATPLALAVGTGRAARRGIFVKSEAVVDGLHAVDTVVLDKTGTVTEGVMAVDGRLGNEALLPLAAALEQDSNHPIAKAILRAAGPQDAAANLRVEHVPGHGQRGWIRRQEVRIGHPEWALDLLGRGPGTDEIRFMQEAVAAAAVVVAVCQEGEAPLLIRLSDPIRPTSRARIEALLSRGLRVILCSGDDQRTTKAVGEQLGLPEADLLGRHTPEDKQTLIESLTAEGRVVVMVGDGVNDTAALRAAHVGIAVSGTSVASRVAADAYTTRPGLEAVVELLEGAHGVLGVIRRNLGFSLLYNVLGGAAALLGFVTPLFAAVAMPISSFIVVLSSIRQRTFTAS
jgi:Cu2+-exporting ATPase